MKTKHLTVVVLLTLVKRTFANPKVVHPENYTTLIGDQVLSNRSIPYFFRIPNGFSVHKTLDVKGLYLDNSLLGCSEDGFGAASHNDFVSLGLRVGSDTDEELHISLRPGFISRSSFINGTWQSYEDLFDSSIAIDQPFHLRFTATATDFIIDLIDPVGGVLTTMTTRHRYTPICKMQYFEMRACGRLDEITFTNSAPECVGLPIVSDGIVDLAPSSCSAYAEGTVANCSCPYQTGGQTWATTTCDGGVWSPAPSGCPGRTVEGISYAGHLIPILAADGIVSTCMATGFHSFPWLRVTLSHAAIVYTIKLRGLEVFPQCDQLGAVWIDILDHFGRATCNVITSPWPADLTVECVSRREGHAIELRAEVNRFAYLKVCEVEVYSVDNELL